MMREYIDSNVFCELNIGDSQQINKKQTQNDVIISKCLTNGTEILLVQSDKSYKTGTIGVVEGEKISKAFEYATKKKLPVVLVVASGGIRVNEGTLALMQMAKMAATVKQHSAKVYYIFLLLSLQHLAEQVLVSCHWQIL